MTKYQEWIRLEFSKAETDEDYITKIRIDSAGDLVLVHGFNEDEEKFIHKKDLKKLLEYLISSINEVVTKAVVDKFIEDNKNHVCNYSDYGWVKVCLYCGKMIVPVPEDVLAKIQALEDRK